MSGCRALLLLLLLLLCLLHQLQHLLDKEAGLRKLDSAYRGLNK